MAFSKTGCFLSKAEILGVACCKAYYGAMAAIGVSPEIPVRALAGSLGGCLLVPPGLAFWV